MDHINELMRDRTAYENEIEEQRQKMRQYEEEYESLRQFHEEVNVSHSRFESENKEKLNRTAVLSSIAGNCRTARVYLEGSQETFNVLGSRIVGAAFTGLYGMIAWKKAEYKGKIQSCENRIASLMRSIDSIDSRIDAAEAERESEAGV